MESKETQELLSMHLQLNPNKCSRAIKHACRFFLEFKLHDNHTVDGVVPVLLQDENITKDLEMV